MSIKLGRLYLPRKSWSATQSLLGKPPLFVWRSRALWRAAGLDGRHLLWLRRSLHADDEKRPLEQTPLGREFEHLHSVLAPATVPRAPQK
jgi:hypothetical protein